jgi:hypothetical protein
MSANGKPIVSRDPILFCRQMGTEVEQEWREVNYDATKFPKIAARALERFSAPQFLDPLHVIRSIDDGGMLARQYDVEGNFSNLPVTLFTSTRFYIDVYFWLTGTTDIHQHGFAGAFQVLSGSSLHSHYEFHPRHRVSPHFALGGLSLKQVKLLSQGDIKEINPGKDYIHSLFHLDNPSVTLTIRTISLPTAQPQFSHLKPGIAYDPFLKDPAIIRRSQSVDVLLGMDHPKADVLIKKLLAGSDLQTAFAVLGIAYTYLCNEPLPPFHDLPDKGRRWDTLLGVVRERHGAAADIFASAFNEFRRQRALIDRRSYVTNAELRFFLALLLNVEGRKRILKLIQQRYPGNAPVETLLNWIEELSRITIADGRGTNALGIENFDDLHLLIIECLVKGRSLSETQTALSSILRHEDPKQLRAKIKTRYHEISRSLILKPLFATG